MSQDAETLPSLDEVRRRQAARALGLPLASSWATRRAQQAARDEGSALVAASVAHEQGAGVVIEHIARPPHERDVQRAVRQRYLEAGCVVYWLSQARATGQTTGVPDLYVFHRGARASWWHEVKPPTGDLSPAQRAFQEHCAATATHHVTGGLEAVEQLLRVLGLLGANAPP